VVLILFDKQSFLRVPPNLDSVCYPSNNLTKGLAVPSARFFFYASHSAETPRTTSYCSFRQLPAYD
jgi:hypothetical protein